MTSAALFRNPTKPQKMKHLYQFRAGKMAMSDEKMVEADPRKGWCYMYQSVDSKVHFCWIDRKTCLVEENITVDAKSSKFCKVTHCKDGRVYVLKSDSKRLFIWMQEPDANNDEKMFTNITNYIKTPPKLDLSAQSDSMSGMNLFSPNELLTLLSMRVGLGGSPDSQDSNIVAGQTPFLKGATSGKVGGATDKKNGKIQLEDLRSIISTISSTGPKGSSSGVGEKEIDLNDVINSTTLKTFLEKPEVLERVKPLLPSMPSSSEDPEIDPIRTAFSDPLDHVRSSQFRATVRSFVSAFRSGQMASVMSQFNLGPKALEAANKGDILAFSKALEEAQKAETDAADQDKMDTN